MMDALIFHCLKFHIMSSESHSMQRRMGKEAGARREPLGLPGTPS